MEGSGLRARGSGFRVQGSGFRVQGSGFRVQGRTGNRTRQVSRQALRGGIPKIQFSSDLLTFSDKYPPKWLQDRANGSKNALGIPPQRAFCGFAQEEELKGATIHVFNPHLSTPCTPRKANTPRNAKHTKHPYLRACPTYRGTSFIKNCPPR